MKVYTRKGDEGMTGLIGGTRTHKDDLRIESYGNVDELNSFLGLVRDHNIDEAYQTFIIEIQDQLFTIGSLLASDPGKSKMKLPEVNDEHVRRLEKEIDRMDQKLEPMRNFVLPGGAKPSSLVHVARCVCRRAERSVVALHRREAVAEIILRYLNRLSDYLFVLARAINHDIKAEEIPWIPSK